MLYLEKWFGLVWEGLGLDLGWVWLVLAWVLVACGFFGFDLGWRWVVFMFRLQRQEGSNAKGVAFGHVQRHKSNAGSHQFQRQKCSTIFQRWKFMLPDE